MQKMILQQKVVQTLTLFFVRNIDKITCKNFVSYFSYYNPVVSIVDE